MMLSRHLRNLRHRDHREISYHIVARLLDDRQQRCKDEYELCNRVNA